MDLDLNEQPEDSSSDSFTGLESLLSEIESAHECIEERIRQLEAVTSRAIQRQRWRQRQQTANVAVEPILTNVLTGVEFLRGDADIATQETTSRTLRFGSDGKHLVAKALNIREDDQNAKSNTGNFFDCNICLDMATDPILACCGHLFCWPCFYQLSYVYSDVKECPVCMKEIPDSGIIPIYGNGNGCSKRKCKSKECGLEVPPRPNARRIEGVRQQLLNSGRFYIPVEERSRQLRHTIIGRSSAERTSFISSPEVLPPSQSESSQAPRSSQVSRLLLQGAASFSSLSSALNSAMDSAERLIEDLEVFVHNRNARRSRLQSSNLVAGGSLSNVSDNDISVLHPASSFRIDDTVNNAVTFLSPEDQRTDAQVYNDSPFPIISSYSRRRTEFPSSLEMSTAPSPSSASRRRPEVPEVPDSEDEPFPAPRRRRLR